MFVGGGYAGIEALAELEDMARYATRYYPELSQGRHALRARRGDRPDPARGRRGPGRYTVDELREREIDVRLDTRLESCVDGHVVLSDGTEFDADTIVWTAGVKANPVLAQTDLPLDDKGRLRCRPDLRVEGVDDAWAAGDGAAVPDLTAGPGSLHSPSAQHAVRQAKVLGDNIAAGAPRPRAARAYAHKHVGSVASLGPAQGRRPGLRRQARGFPAWFMHRTYHVSRVPTLVNRKVRRASLDWTLALFFKRDVVSLGRR